MNIRHEVSQSLATRLYRQRSNIKDEVIAGKVGVDKTTIGRYFNGGAGIPIEHLEDFLLCLGMVVVTQKYLTAITTLSEVGVHCECARSGAGECGSRS